jgi:L-glutamine-phosphate cytidylyltransferase
MKVIILAAGEGTRLRPLTLNNPKCLVELFGKSILQWQIDTFNDFQIKNIIIVKGYLEKKINLPNITYYINEKFSTTNMVETLFSARNEMNESIIVSYGDIIFEKNVLNELLTSQADISLVVDTNWLNYWKQRFKEPLDDAESLVIDDEGNIISIGQKIKKLDQTQAQYIGLMKFQGKGLEQLKSFYDQSKALSKSGKNPLNPNLDFNKSYMTDLLQGMINNGIKIKAIPIKNSWLELDSYNDYLLYSQMYENKTLSEFFDVNI